ncbi:MAG TPA: metallophosphoesterase [Opitutaceae bacterium]|nr:metallophosphoesterase [Opitutaceae bacterium]
MGTNLIRIVSDVHFADHSSRVRSLDQLRPLLEGAASFVFNGDTLDTRPGRNAQRTAQKRREVLDFFASCGTDVTFLTGNHDPDLSRLHALEFESGRILVTHGDVLFDAIVPWAKDAAAIRQKVVTALAALPEDGTCRLDGRLAAFRSVAATIPQRHQSEPDPLRYALRLAGDTVWPPGRVLSILRAWREAPGKAAALARRHRPRARLIAIGHTHIPGVWRTASGIVVVNTGSFCRPFGAMAAEISPGLVRVRRVELRRGEFHPGSTVAEFPHT